MLAKALGKTEIFLDSILAFVIAKRGIFNALIVIRVRRCVAAAQS
jgi:hypothetical protein